MLCYVIGDQHCSEQTFPFVWVIVRERFNVRDIVPVLCYHRVDVFYFFCCVWIICSVCVREIEFHMNVAQKINSNNVIVYGVARYTQLYKVNGYN